MVSPGGDTWRLLRTVKCADQLRFVPHRAGCPVLEKLGLVPVEDCEKKTTERNDRVIAIEDANHSYAHIGDVKDLGKQFRREVEAFFVNYHQLSGEKYRIIDVKGPSAAIKRIKNGRRAFKKS